MPTESNQAEQPNPTEIPDDLITEAVAEAIARGNVHSEEEDVDPGEAPPPMAV